MKNSIMILCAVLALLLIGSHVSSCARQPVTLPTEETEDDAAYLTRIEALEAELQRQREERFISESTRDAQIQELQQRLEALDGNIETDATETPDGETLIFHYRIENGKAIITGYSGASPLVTVPGEVNGYPVVALGERAFEGKDVAAVILPKGLEAVGWFAFYGCEALINITLPSSVTSIGYAVFDGCPNVTLVCPVGSYAAQYAASYGLPHISR